MKRIVSFLLVLCTCLVITAGNAGGLKWRKYWLELLTPVNNYKFADYLSMLDQFHADHPKLMTDGAYARLRELGESADLAAGAFTRDEDPFEDNLYLWPSALQRPGEDQRVVAYIDDYTSRIAFVAIDREWWLRTEKAIFLADTGDRMTITVNTWDGVKDYTSGDDYMETYTPALGYSEDQWFEMFSNPELSSVAVRFYGKESKTEDYTLTEAEIQAIRDVLNLQYVKEQLSDALQEWCKSIEKVDE